MDRLDIAALARIALDVEEFRIVAAGDYEFQIAAHRRELHVAFGLPLPEKRALRGWRFTGPDIEHVDAVNLRIRTEASACGYEEGREEIGHVDDRVRFTSRRHVSRPTHRGGHAN